MAQAVAADASRIEDCQPVLLRDMRVPSLVAPGAELIEVDSHAEHQSQFREQCERSDTVLLIAPETDGALLEAAKTAERLGAKLLSPSPELIRAAGDKLKTAELLKAAGIPVPEGRLMEPSAPLPEDFPYPAVIKPIDGAGSQDTHVVPSPAERPPAYAWARRLERFVPGAPVSVATICGESPLPLPACRQVISGDGRLAYIGGSTPLPSGMAQRAEALALQTIEAMPTASGYVGVDLVLGAAPDGTEDFVIEVNPRLTTSYVGLRAATKHNLLSAMLEVSQGRTPQLEFDPRSIAFDADGSVYYD